MVTPVLNFGQIFCENVCTDLSGFPPGHYVMVPGCCSRLFSVRGNNQDMRRRETSFRSLGGIFRSASQLLIQRIKNPGDDVIYPKSNLMHVTGQNPM